MIEDNGMLIRNVYHMLGYVFPILEDEHYESVEFEKIDEVYDLLALIFSKGLIYQLKHGLRKENGQEEGAVTTSCGELNFRERMKLKHPFRRRAHEYDNYLENNLFNQVLKSGAVLLSRNKKVQTPRKFWLNETLLFFKGVDDIDMKLVNLDDVQYDSDNEDYQLLMAICNFLKLDLLPNLDFGQYRYVDFSDESRLNLFRRFVGKYYRKEYPNLKAGALKVGWNIKLNSMARGCLPDMNVELALDMGERKLIIETQCYGDAMGNGVDKEAIMLQHCEQVFSYMMNWDGGHGGKVDGMLLYVKSGGDDCMNNMVEFADGNRFFVRTLDLNLDFVDIKNRLDEVVEWYECGKIFWES